ncbi:response regulator transcription factor [Paenibacillus arenilitoris]|uniref:Response regulator n=1 Tax=Paenibacillus arenilitoris TaxID=2772299 RepID=A0A927CNY4_9BACL|nr:helix-turn-helix domain-containing protein [Paenibacillus arenilitoris]MBD2870870.1 response regulator [Paenibacillus arenilitoris]
MIKVLVVDDDKLVRKGLISAMPWAEFGMQVVGEANNGEKALEFLQANPVDLLLTDLAMPVMSGIELMRSARRLYPELYIVVLTLHQDFDYIQEALRLGAIDYIAKVQLEKERFEEVLGRVHARIQEERKKSAAAGYGGEDLFYEDRPGVGRGTRSADDPGKEYDADGSALAGAKGQWLALEWIHDDALYAKLRDELKAMRLSASRLISFFYAIESEWKRVYAAVTDRRVAEPGPFDNWLEAEAWLQSVRDLTAQVAGGKPYSQEVVDCVMKAVKIVQEELDKQLFVMEVARRVNMSRSYFSQCFKEITGKSFNEYLRQTRIEKAKDYLTHTNKSVQWIAEHTGYMDEKYFSRLFREYTGMLPSEYRQKPQG